MPFSNLGTDFAKLPAYVADILYLDKPDIILSARTDEFHEKPIISIELASCTPQYQHALQRFSRMMASVVNGCPSVLVMAPRKAENSGGTRMYQRSKAVDYGAVRLMDIYRIPAFVFDWPEEDGILCCEGATSFPQLSTASMQSLKAFVSDAIASFGSLDYVEALWRLPSARRHLEEARTRAYASGPPTVERPGGGVVVDGRGPAANLVLRPTADVLEEVRTRIARGSQLLAKLPPFISDRSQSLVFSPTRFMDHAGDPYVGMIGYYDMAFCRIGKSSRERQYNLVADCRTISAAEVEDSMRAFNDSSCPFQVGITPANVLQYAYHLKHGCRETKPKPIRIYSELADLVIFSDRILFNAG
ncbi:hypothetical protein LZ009_17570 [Ramlibacter sp. XY19]|uniref:hypothetical protein n=1 Tax=Ramlibacter paludis TaxID=2908000 RepID=UPI0023DB1920|nr:hypothetical protein [Ramlibacter paludis]MCG2594590.1 hypothetical protein [Ramlibacter paludis]